MLAEKEQKLAALEKALFAAQEKVTQLAGQARELRKEIANEKLEVWFQAGITAEKVMGVAWTLVDDSAWYRKLSNWLNKLPGVYQSGYYPETDQVAVKVMLRLNESLDKQLGILELLPHIKPLKHGRKEISIFEHTCGESGTFRLEVSANDETDLVKQAYGQSKVLQTFPTPMEAIKYVWRHHPYE